MKGKNIVIGITAHVDAGKTTLAESIMYITGGIRKVGRVDHGDAFLDTHELEKKRGITIFSKQAEVRLKDKKITLLDTPGHVDFSAETERTMQVLDAAILVISGADGVQGHVVTLWKLLKRYGVPVFLFVNKMDQPDTDKEKLLAELKDKLDENCVDFSSWRGIPADETGLAETGYDEFLESVAMCSEPMMEQYLEAGTVDASLIRDAIASRHLFPCFFGSALKIEGVEEFLEGLNELLDYPEYPEEFSARVYKISRDDNGNRLTHIKVTGGSLKVKQVIGEDKVDQIRIYSGTQFALTDVAEAGTLCALTGLPDTKVGQGIGNVAESEPPMLVPVLNYQIVLPEGADVTKTLRNLYVLEEEIPEMHVVWREQSGEIHVQVMGEVQVEILKSIIEKRFGLSVEFSNGSIVYKETILEPMEGIGHFEPLRHYAEVHLLMEPLEVGSGLVFESRVLEEDLDRNWQRLILTHLEERAHPGVLIGAEITDMKISIIAGRAHLKHTEGGDFRQATYRAVRHGLKRAKCRILEPVYEFALELPTECLGRAMTDIQRMCGDFESPETDGEMSILRGTAPVVNMNGYQMEVNSYTRGRGKLNCRFKAYMPCHNEEEVLAKYDYDSERDLQNPTGSVFCAHGAGFVVPWEQVEDYAHIETEWEKLVGGGMGLCGTDGGYGAGDGLNRPNQGQEGYLGGNTDKSSAGSGNSYNERFISQEEIETIFEQSYRTKSKDKNPWNRPVYKESVPAREVVYKPKKSEKKEEYLLVDGYNIIFAWEDLKELAATNVEAARTKLMDMLCNYQGYVKNTLIVVFDAYKVKGNPGSVMKYHNIHVVYTREAETADQYIEKVVHDIGHKYNVTVATSDALEQMIIWGAGATRLSAQGLRAEMDEMNKVRMAEWEESNVKGAHFPFAGVKIEGDVNE